MEFNNLYEKSIKLWPIEIDISDGKEVNKGFLFANLSSIWNDVEGKAKELGEWFDLMTWIIFVSLHAKAKQDYQKDIKYIDLSQLNIDEIKDRLAKNLQVEGYEDMFNEYQRNNLS